MIDLEKFEEIKKAVSKSKAETSVYRQVADMSLKNARTCVGLGQIEFFDAWMAIEKFCENKLSENLKLLEDLSKELKDPD
jgi:hypothetical protein